ncbi:MAG: hypothetical protein DI539_17905 [Flavobacterium psychrophilum]|nr:MAG: hypothetical protein DI539_17905 [Flavobacterium psychrophilum]
MGVVIPLQAEDFGYSEITLWNFRKSIVLNYVKSDVISEIIATFGLPRLKSLSYFMLFSKLNS